MVFLAAAEILTIFTGIILLIWRLQFIFPEFGFILLGILVLTLLVHRDGWRNLGFGRSEEHTSELQSHHDLVCRLLLEKKKTTEYGRLFGRQERYPGQPPDHYAYVQLDS